MRYIAFATNQCVGCCICEMVCSGTWHKVFNPLKAGLRIEQTEWYGRKFERSPYQTRGARANA